jgi:hypothetical protein
MIDKILNKSILKRKIMANEKKERTILELEHIQGLLEKKLESKTPFIIKKGSQICGQQVFMTDCSLQGDRFYIKFDTQELKDIGPDSEIRIFVGIAGVTETITAKAKTSIVSFKPNGVVGTVIL